MVDFIWPWPKDTRASQEFGTNPGGVNPAGGHTGLDAALAIGTPLRAPADGTVTFEGWANLSNNPYLLTDGGGICLAIDFGDNRPAAIMGHLSATFVGIGDRVKQGAIVAESGNTGKWTTGPHTHLEFLAAVFNLNSSTYGRSNPRDFCTAYWEDVLAASKPVLKPFQRLTRTVVRERTAPSTAALIVREWDPETYFDMGGYVVGQDANGDGNRVWFKGKYSDVYFHSSGFTDQDVHDLPNLTPPATVPVPTTPTPKPVPVPEPVVVALHGVDVSGHQGDINLALLPGDFVGIKATEGDGWADPKLERNAKNAESKTRIFYHFARPDLGNTAKAELAWFLKTVAPYLRTGDILSLDWERVEGKPSFLDRVEWVQEFLDGADAAHGGRSLLYTGNEAIAAAGPAWAPVETRHPLWYPAYNTPAQIDGFKPQLAGTRPPVIWNGKPMLIWQYTSNGRLPAYAGPLDMNVLYGTRDDLAALGITRTTAPAPAPVPDPTPAPVPTPDPARVPPTKDQPISALIDYYKEQQ